MVGTVTDICETKGSVHPDKASDSRLRTPFEHLPSAYQFLDQHGNWLDANELMVRLLGYDDPKAMTGESFLKHMDSSDTETLSLIRTDLTAIHEVEKELRLIGCNGRPMVVLMSARIQRDPEGRSVGIHSTLVDVTAPHERLRASQTRIEALELEVTQQAAALQEARKARGEFLAHMSHEIRNPMNIIAVNTHLLDQTPLTEMQKGIISRTRRASSAMLSLLDQVLEYSKLEAGEIQLDLAPFSLTELLNNILLLQRGTARDKAVDFLIGNAAIVPDTWVGDRRHIEKILIHLTSNAIKCTDTGQIRIKASLDQRPGENQALRIEVTDTGRGIPEDQLPMLFQPFKRISHPSGEPVKGTGLGLSISKRLVELMGGRIGVNSALGLGSCFWFTVPTATSDPDSPPPLSDPLS